MIAKKSQSQVVATVLLILLVISSIVVVMAFVIPFIRERISEGDCFDVIDEVELVDNSKYTCFDSGNANDLSDDYMRFQVHFGDNSSLGGFMVVFTGITSQSYKVPSNPPTVLGYTGTSYSGTAILPDKNQEKTYGVFTNLIPDSIKIHPILKDGRVCDKSDEILIGGKRNC